MKQDVIDFLRYLAIGKQLETDEVVYMLEEGKLKGVYNDSMYFSDLSETENGFAFHLTTVSHEKIYEVDAEGNPTILQKDFSGTSVYRYEIAYRKSTGELTGYMRLLSSTVKDQTMEGIIYGVYAIKAQEDELRWKESQLFYRDIPASKGKYRPVAFNADIRFYFEEGKLLFEYIPYYFDVHPTSMEKIPSKDKYPPYITKEK